MRRFLIGVGAVALIGVVGGWLYLLDSGAAMGTAHAQVLPGGGGSCAPGKACVVSTLTATKNGTGAVNVGVSSGAGRLHVLSEAANNTPTEFTDDHVVIGRSASTGASSGAIFIQYNSTGNAGLIGSLSPGSAWRDMYLAAANVRFQDASGSPVSDLLASGVINSRAAAAASAFTCTNVGCRISMGNTGRYFFDTGSSLAVTGGLAFGATGTAISSSYVCEGTIDFGSITNHTCDDSTYSCTGVSTSGTLAIQSPAFSSGEEVNLSGPFYRISAADTISVRLCNFTASDIDPGSANFRVRYFQ